MSQTEIKVPNIGDFKDVEVIEVLVKEGDEVKKNDPLITIESDKSSVEIPSTVDGKIIKLNLKIGDKVSEGDNILQIEINTKSNEKPSKNLTALNVKGPISSIPVSWAINVVPQIKVHNKALSKDIVLDI
jgi:pyruvate dehydrogenase E2 component (dihydrolipoamide acetyltransferase)